MNTSTQPATTPSDRSTALIDHLLKLPEEVRSDLGQLLLDSVRDGFTSRAEAADRDQRLIRERLEQLVSGKVELLDAEQVFANIEARLAEVRKK